jgi:hypothetical protein
MELTMPASKNELVAMNDTTNGTICKSVVWASHQAQPRFAIICEILFQASRNGAHCSAAALVAAVRSVEERSRAKVWHSLWNHTSLAGTALCQLLC